MLLLLFNFTILSNDTFWQFVGENKSIGQSIDCQPHFGHQVGCRKASSANYAAQVREKTAVGLLSDRLLG